MIADSPTHLAARSIQRGLDAGEQISLAAIINVYNIRDPEEIGYLIDVHGRKSISLGHSVWLSDYIYELGEWIEESVVLDAAIDMSLRDQMSRGLDLDAARARLLSEFPEFEAQIENAVELEKSMWNTEDARAGIDHAHRELPCAFGPIGEDGSGRYQLVEVIGSGSTSVVYRAVDRILSDEEQTAHVAIKVFPPNPPQSSSAYLDEAKKGRRVDHQSVATIFDTGRTDKDEDYIVFEFVEGSRLDSSLSAFPTIKAKVRLMVQIAQGVQAIHAAGLAHCDLKPYNILINSHGFPKIIDLGLAARESRWHSSSEEKTLGLGTLAFMSPQQYQNRPLGFAPPSDIWALGGILYWLLTGRIAAGNSIGDVEHALETGFFHFDWPSRSGKAIPRDLRKIIEHAMACDPANRFASAAEFAAALEDWLAHRPQAWAKPGAGRVFGLWVRRRPAVAALSVIAASGLIAGGYFAMAQAAEKKWRAQAANYHSFLIRSESKFAKSEFLARQLGTIALGEWFYGPYMFRDQTLERGFTDLRIAALETRYNKAMERGDAADLSTLLLESSIALWLAEDGQWQRAIPILERNRRSWQERLDESDEWFAMLDAIETCCEVDRLMHESRDAGRDRNVHTSEAERLHQQLSEALSGLRTTDGGGAVALIVYDRLVTLLGPEMLDRPTEFDEMRQKRDRYRLASGAH